MSDARQFSTVIVTGGCGFVGSHFIRHILRVCPNWAVINLDKLTKTGDPMNLADVAKVQGGARGDSPSARYRFVQGDACDRKPVQDLLTKSGSLASERNRPLCCRDARESKHRGCEPFH